MRRSAILLSTGPVAWRSLLCLVVASVSLEASAVLVQRDWQQTGDGMLTYDSDTGLEWLDITVTTDMSYNDVLAKTGSGGTYDGFSFASEQQVLSLFHSGGLYQFYDGNSQEQTALVENLLAYWGVVWQLGTGERTEFITSNTDGLVTGQHWNGRLVWLGDGTAAYTTKYAGRDDDYSIWTIGSALVRPAQPLPITGDITGNGIFDTGDLVVMFNIILGVPVNEDIEPGYGDFYPPSTPDGIIDMSDLLRMIQALY